MFAPRQCPSPCIIAPRSVMISPNILSVTIIKTTRVFTNHIVIGSTCAKSAFYIRIFFCNFIRPAPAGSNANVRTLVFSASFSSISLLRYSNAHLRAALNTFPCIYGFLHSNLIRSAFFSSTPPAPAYNPSVFSPHNNKVYVLGLFLSF